MSNTVQMHQQVYSPDDNEVPNISMDVVVGVIQYPCCPTEKVIVYEGAHGRTSNKCPRCGKFAEIDYDRMYARRSRPCRGASKAYRPHPAV